MCCVLFGCMFVVLFVGLMDFFRWMVVVGCWLLVDVCVLFVVCCSFIVVRCSLVVVSASLLFLELCSVCVV